MQKEKSANVFSFEEAYVKLRLRRVRLNSKRTLDDLANIICVPPHVIEAYENGKIRIPLNHLLKIKKYLSVDLVELIPILDKDAIFFQSGYEEMLPWDFNEMDHISATLLLAKNKNLSIREFLLKRIAPKETRQ